MHGRRLRQFGRSTIVSCGLLALCGLLAACGLLVARTARAQSAVDQAREHYRKGTAAYNLGHYAEAAREYEATYELTLDPAALFNTAQAYRLSGETQKAIAAYKGYLRAAPQGSQREVAQQKLDELTRAGTSPGPAPAPLAPGAPAPPPMAPAAIAPAGGEATAALAAPPPAAAATTLVQAPPPAAERPLYERWPFWAAAGVVVVAAVLIGVVLASSSHDLPAQATTYGAMTF